MSRYLTWQRLLLLAVVVAVAVALLLPAIQPSRENNETEYREWQRRRDAEPRKSLDDKGSVE